MICVFTSTILFFFNETATTEICTLSLHDALPILARVSSSGSAGADRRAQNGASASTSDVTASACSARSRSEEHTSVQSRQYLVCRLLLEKKKKKQQSTVNLNISEYTTKSCRSNNG